MRAEQSAGLKVAAAALTYLRSVLGCFQSLRSHSVIMACCFWALSAPVGHHLLTNACAPAAVAEETAASHAEADQDGDVEEL